MIDHKPQFTLAVKDMVALCLDGGDATGSGLRAPSAEDGRVAQRHLQQQTLEQQTSDEEPYRKEVPVSQCFDFSLFTLQLRGRIDGVQETDDCLIIEEIKATRHAQGSLPRAADLQHRYQTLIYAALALAQHAKPYCLLRRRYWHLDSQQSYHIEERLDSDSLATEFSRLLTLVSDWLTRVHAHRAARNTSLSAIDFPHASYRTGQRALAVDVYRTIQHGSRLVVHAATGLGKTITTLFPALKALAYLQHQQIWYLTAKRSGRRAVFHALTVEGMQSVPLKVLELPARQQICACQAAKPTGDADCIRLIDYYARRHAALNMLWDERILDADCLQRVADAHQCCPYRLAQDLVIWADVIVGDFNQIFDLGMHPGDYLQSHGKHALLLVDEAHNLPERARALYQASLRTADINHVLRQLPRKTALRRPLTRLKRWLVRFAQDHAQQPFAGNQPVPDALPLLISDAMETLHQWLLTPTQLFPDEEALNWLFDLMHWQRLLGYWGEHMQLVVEQPESQNTIRLRVQCLDPSPILTRLQARFAACILFSGSLLPLPYFRAALLGSEQEPYTLNLSSPFDATRLGVYSVPVNTQWQQREQSLPDIASYLELITRSQPGRYLVCCPSYPYLAAISAFCRQQGKWHDWLLLEQQIDSKVSVDNVLSALNATSQGVAFVIMGGALAEGIEFTAGGLQGVAIVGTGMPPPDPAREQQRLYWQKQGYDGFDFAYRYPGLQRIIQSAGRIQRGENDRGVVILMEQRFFRRRQRIPFPEHWTIQDCATPSQLSDALASFWQRHDPEQDS